MNHPAGPSPWLGQMAFKALFYSLVTKGQSGLGDFHEPQGILTPQSCQKETSFRTG